jgi:hypothetical protein
MRIIPRVSVGKTVSNEIGYSALVDGANTYYFDQYRICYGKPGYPEYAFDIWVS